MKKVICLIRNGEESFDFVQVEPDKWIEVYSVFEEDPDSPESAVGEWKVYHTVKYLHTDAVKEFAARLKTVGFVG